MVPILKHFPLSTGVENDTIEEDNALSHLAKTVTDRVPNKFDYHVQFEAQWIIRFQDMTFLVVN